MIEFHVNESMMAETEKARQGCVWQDPLFLKQILSIDWTSDHGVTQMSKTPSDSPRHKVRQVSSSPFLYVQKWYMCEEDWALQSTKPWKTSDLSYVTFLYGIILLSLSSLTSGFIEVDSIQLTEKLGHRISVYKENSSTLCVGTSKK